MLFTGALVILLYAVVKVKKYKPMSDEGKTKELVEVARTAIEMANDLIYRQSDDKEDDYWQAVQFLDQFKDNHPELIAQDRALYGQLLETLAVALVRGMNFIQAEAVLDMYRGEFLEEELPDRLQEVSKITSAKFSSIDDAAPV